MKIFWIQVIILFATATLVTASWAASHDIQDDYSVALQPWIGDYDKMVQRKMVRILVPYSWTHFFLDGATKRGVIAEMGREFEQEINNREGLQTRLVHVVFIPVPRSQLIPWLMAGKGDIAAGGLTITESRKAKVDFSNPVLRDSKEFVVTGPGSRNLRKIEDLAGLEVHVQESSSYYKSLNQLNRIFEEIGLSPVKIKLVDERLEPDEILEMVQAGLIPVTVVDSKLAEFWSQVFPKLVVHSDLVVADGRDFAWAFRKDSPKLKKVLNKFLAPRRHGTKLGNIRSRRYLQNITWVRNATASTSQERFDLAMPLFQKYGEQYTLDPLLLAALGYQESRLDQSVVSRAGAIGVMQLMPSTAASLQVGDITKLEPNIHGGARYLRQLMDGIASPDVNRLNQTLFGLASYNAGQPRIRRLRLEAAEQGLDPNVWFHNVELAAARVMGRQTVQHVRNIYKYYLVFRQIEDKRTARSERALER